jgi:divalent metal cation (Fe/Co/Zn/Cd) transporter
MLAFWHSFLLIFVAEMGDKSQLMALAFGTHLPARLVLAGIFVATLLVHLVSVALGEVLGLALPTFWINLGAGLAFIGFGLWTLRGDRLDEQRAEVGKRFGAVAMVAATFFVASLVNLVVAWRLREAGRVYQSITLEADAKHLLTDIWTSAGVIVGVGAVALTGWIWLDPVIALGVGLNIIWSGVQLMRRSALGLLDTAIPSNERATLHAVLERYREQGIQWHAVRTRQAGARRFVSLHVLVPGAWTVQRGHDLLEAVERDIRTAIPNASVFTHLEPVEDPVAWEDIGLDRPGS